MSFLPAGMGRSPGVRIRRPAGARAEGDQALTQAIVGVRARGGIVIVVAHRTSALAGVDQLMVMTDGRVQALGQKDVLL